MLLDRRGNEVAALHADVDRVLIPFAQMPLSLRHAVVAVEDEDFYRHDGLDKLAVVRAAWTNVTSGSMSQGGSTITQQYVKNVLTGSEHSLARKVREAILAVKLEHTMSKRQILGGYLNTVYFGHGAYGVQAAARTYFDRDAKDLTLAQSATLAGLIAAPSARDPFDHPGEARHSRDLALDRMAEVGSISIERARRLQARPLGLAEEANVRSAAPYFMEHVRLDLKSELRVGRALPRRSPRPNDPGSGVAARRRARGPQVPAVPDRPGGRARRDRPEDGGDPGDGGRAELRTQRVQPRHAGAAPGRERLQAVRPRRGARARDLAARGPQRAFLAHDPGSVL